MAHGRLEGWDDPTAPFTGNAQCPDCPMVVGTRNGRFNPHAYGRPFGVYATSDGWCARSRTLAP